VVAVQLRLLRLMLRLRLRLMCLRRWGGEELY
jgi:hypothetical protein